MLLLLVLIKSRNPSLIFWLLPFVTGLLQSDTADRSAHKDIEREKSDIVYVIKDLRIELFLPPLENSSFSSNCFSSRCLK